MRETVRKLNLVRTAFYLTVCAVLFGLMLATNLSATPTFPHNQKIDKSGVWLANAVEASWFIWSNELYYVYTNRNISGSSTEMKVVRWSDKAVISTFGSGYGCQDVLVDSGTLYVFATNCKMDYTHTGNSIVKFTSSNLTSWSGPSTIYTVESSSQIYNVAVTHGSEYVIAFEIHNPYWYNEYFVIRFLGSSSPGSGYTSKGDSHVLVDNSCPDIHYVNSKYYIWSGQDERSHSSYTTNFSTFTTSVLPTIKPVHEYEDIFTSDPDLIEFDGKVYIFYGTGNQTTYFRLTYATYDGTLAQLIDAYQQN